MSDTENKRYTGKLNTIYFALFGGAIGAVLGILAYINNWLG